MDKKRFFIHYSALFILFAVFNAGYFALYRTSFLLKDGVITDYYLAAVLGLMYAFVPAVAPDLVYNLMVLALLYLSGLTLTLMLKAFDAKDEILLPAACFYMFSGFSIIVGCSHPDLIFVMLLLPPAITLFKKKKIVPGAVITAINLILILNLLRGDAPACLMRWIGGFDGREICYLAIPLLLLAALAVMRHKKIIEGRFFAPLLIMLVFYADLITNFFEFSIFEGDAVNSLYVNSGNIYGSLLSIADIVFKGGSL